MPAMFRVTLMSGGGTIGSTAATHTGVLYTDGSGKDYTDPAQPQGSVTVHTVTANDQVSAIQQVMRGRITVSIPAGGGGQYTANNDFTAANSSTDVADHKAFLIARTTPLPPPPPPGPPQPGAGTEGGPTVIDYEVRLEDMIGLIPGQEPDQGQRISNG